MKPEDKLIRKIQQGDSSCLQELFQIYYEQIYKYCLWHTSDVQTAEDAVQETFLKIMTHIQNFNQSGKFKGYIYTVAANTCKDIWKKRALIAEREHVVMTREQYIELGYELSEGQLTLMKLIDKLPEQQREIAILRFSSDLTILEISRSLGMPYRTVQTNLRSIIRKVRKKVEGEREQ